MRPNKPAMRLAVAIHKQLVCRDSTSVVCDLPEASWQQYQVLSRRVQRAQQRGWRLAARRCERDFRAVIDRLHGDLAVIAQGLDANHLSHRPTATIQDIYHDVLALHDEFEEVSWDHPQQTLSATTEPIELEGVYLGEFEIRLDWGDLVDGLVTFYLLFAMELKTRRVHFAGCTTNPDDIWMKQVAHELTNCEDGFLLGKTVVLMDRDAKFSQTFRDFLDNESVKPLRLPPRSPNLNAHLERFMRSIKCESLDWMIFFGERSLRRAVHAYLEHYHAERNHH